MIYARAGESRVVPIVITNPRRRERNVELAISGWTPVCDNTAAAETESFGPTEFEIPACGEKSVLLKVRTSAGQDKQDVASCSVLYADLTVRGCCDVRPIRIAVAILPATCDPFEIGCQCGCC